MEPLFDHSLLQRCIDEDQRAQAALYRYIYRRLIGVCWRYASDKEQAVEYMNLGFVRILLNLKKYRVEVPFDLWARRVMINTIINEFKKNKGWKERNVFGQTENINISDELDLSDHQQEMLELIRTKALNLPPVTLRVFNLYAIDGYSHIEISEMLGISEGTSAWHFSEAKKRIRQMIGLNK